MNLPDAHNAVLVTEYQYFPIVDWFTSLGDSTHIILEQYENFQKMTFRNRMVLAGSSGPVLLSIPIVGGRNQKRVMKDVLIENRSNWQENHWRTIVSCYSRSPWFEYYRDELAEIFSSRFERLVDWNRQCLGWSLKKLGLDLSVTMTENWREEYRQEGWLDWRNKFEPQALKGLPAARVYRQVFQERTGFLPHLSILDLLFCEGRNASQVLWGS